MGCQNVSDSQNKKTGCCCGLMSKSRGVTDTASCMESDKSRCSWLRNQQTCTRLCRCINSNNQGLQEKGAETGILDSESDAEFDALLDSIKPVWSVRENGFKVFEYIKQKSEMMKKHMIAKVRRLAGLPSISSSVDVPVKFYTLEAESTNNRIKTKKQRKASGFLGTMEAIRVIDAEQQEDFAMAVAGLHENLQLTK